MCLLVLALLAAFLLGGCVGGDSGLKPDPNAGKSLAQRQEEQIKTIQDNPHMTDDQKQMAIGAVNGHGHPTKQ